MMGENAFAYDIAVNNDDGVTIYYNYINERKELQVTYRSYSSYSGYSSNYSGDVVIPNEVTYKDNNLKVTSIGNYAFYGCSYLSSVTIPESVISIYNYAFYGCIDLASINVESENTKYDSRNGCNAIIETTTNVLILGCKNTTIPNSVESIGSSAFLGCSNLTSITIPNSVSSIGNSAFFGCSGLSSVTIPNSVTSIGDDAFSGCSGLTYITIPNSVISIGRYAFRNCNQLTSVIIGSGVTSISSYAFSGTNLTKTIWLTNTPPSGYSNAAGKNNYVANDQYSLSNKIVYPFLSSYFEADGIIYVPVSPSERTCDAIDCIYDENVEHPTIASTTIYKGITMKVLNVLPYLAYNNTFIKSVTIDYDGILPNYAFYGCSNLESAIISDRVTAISNYAFQGCSSLRSVVASQNESETGTLNIANNIKSIGNYAFDGCNSLAKAIIPYSVSSIDNYAFQGCTGLKTIIIADREEELTLGSNGSSPLFASCPLDYVYIGGNISYNVNKNYGYSPFYRNTTLRTVVITDKETEISPNEFYGCTNLQNFSVGDGVTSFGDWAFSGCSSLKTLAFGSQLSTIGKEAFSDCAAVTEIKSKATTPPTCGSQALDDINKWNCKLIVPVSCMTAYQSADQWKEFFFVEEDGVAPKQDYTLTYMVDGEVYKTITIKEDESIAPESAPTKEGYTFSGWSDLPGTMPDHDVTVTGSFTINKYKLTYIVDGEEYKSYEIEYNSDIDAEEAPTKEGYTFSGWSEIPETMPAKDVTITGTFIINSYKLIYKVDEEEYESYDVEYNSAIIAESAPTKEGYTFSGWSEIPETMPAYDVTVIGSFTINSYKLTYIVDGEEYKSIEVEYNSSITPETDPTKDGYDFSGWSEIPETMPAHNVTITGSFERRYDVGNVTSLISFILRGNGGSDDLAIYDKNGNGVLDIGDLILIVRKVLDNTRRSAITRADINPLTPDLTRYSAAQFVLNAPENVREQDIRLAGGIEQTHQIMCKQIEPGAYAVVVYSLTNSLFTPVDGGIIEVNDGKAHSGDLYIQDVLLANPTGETKRYDNMPVATKISDVEKENGHRQVYDLKGQKQNRTDGLQKGVYIENGKKIVVK